LLYKKITEQLWIKQNIRIGLNVILTIVTKENHDEHHENRDFEYRGHFFKVHGMVINTVLSCLVINIIP